MSRISRRSVSLSGCGPGQAPTGVCGSPFCSSSASEVAAVVGTLEAAVRPVWLVPDYSLDGADIEQDALYSCVRRLYRGFDTTSERTGLPTLEPVEVVGDHRVPRLQLLLGLDERFPGVVEILAVA